MRAVALLPLIALASACSTSDQGSPPSPDAGAVFPGYKPEGCAYSVNPPESRAFTDLALDEPAPLADPGAAKPLRVRLGLGGGTNSSEPGYADPTKSVVFTWSTDAPSRAAKVRFGTSPDALTQMRAGYVWANTPAALGGGEPPANMHEVHVCGLEPGKTYYYQVGGGAPGADVWSATQSFTTPPASGKILVGISGDSRNDVDVFRTVQARMRDAGTQLQLLSGDFVEFGTLRAQFDQWLDAAWKDPRDPSKFLTLGQQMILPVPGNHENSSGLFFSMFALPGDGPDAESFGSFDLGPAHVVLFDDQPVASQPDSPTARAILSFLDEDLARAESKRQSVPFLVAVHHRGELSTSKHAGDSDMVTARDKLFPIWEKHHVDLVLDGHDHNYERSKPVTGPASAPSVKASPAEGTTFIVCAGSGAPAYAPGKDPAPFREKNVGFGDTSNLGYAGVYGLLALEGRKLTFTAYGLKLAGADDVIDTFETTR